MCKLTVIGVRAEGPLLAFPCDKTERERIAPAHVEKEKKITR